MDRKKVELYRKRLLDKQEELTRSVSKSDQDGREADEEATQDIADKAAKPSNASVAAPTAPAWPAIRTFRSSASKPFPGPAIALSARKSRTRVFFSWRPKRERPAIFEGRHAQQFDDSVTARNAHARRLTITPHPSRASPPSACTGLPIDLCPLRPGTVGQPLGFTVRQLLAVARALDRCALLPLRLAAHRQDGRTKTLVRRVPAG
jgi:hypothetical protein